jgi:hypothetical protein
MSVGIAVLREDAKSAVVIPDRLVGSGNLGIDTDCVKLTNHEPKRVSKEVGTVGRQTDMAIVNIEQTARFSRSKIGK